MAEDSSESVWVDAESLRQERYGQVSLSSAGFPSHFLLIVSIGSMFFSAGCCTAEVVLIIFSNSEIAYFSVVSVNGERVEACQSP